MEDSKQGVGSSECENTVALNGDVVEYVIAAPVDEREAERLDTVGTEHVNKGEASYVLIDLKKSTQFSSAARKRWVKFLQNPKIKRAAIFGGNVFVRTLASFVMAASKGDNIKFFSNRDDAMKWLKG